MRAQMVCLLSMNPRVTHKYLREYEYKIVPREHVHCSIKSKNSSQRALCGTAQIEPQFCQSTMRACEAFGKLVVANRITAYWE